MIEPLPDQLKFSDFEMQLIAKDLLFMKVFSLPKSRMPAIRDKVINVPLTNVDIDRTTKLLPRSVDDSLLVNVQLKRSKELKNVHSQAFVRSNMLIEALTYLKASGNPFYSDVVVNESIQVTDENESTNIDVPNEADENNENTPPVETDVGLDTCFIPQNSAAHLISNNGTLHKVLSDTIVVAPGENKFPTNWLSNKDFEAKSFPCLFPSGRNTLNEKRVKQISIQQYFNQRIMNKNSRYAKDSAYLFAAQQRVEREQLERQCDVFFRKGKTERVGFDTIKVSQDDVQTVFQRLRGTSQYWRVARNELLAKVKQLGPFQYFFTLSCAEMRWPEVLVSILKSNGHRISSEITSVPNGFNCNIFVDDGSIFSL